MKNTCCSDKRKFTFMTPSSCRHQFSSHFAVRRVTGRSHTHWANTRTMDETTSSASTLSMETVKKVMDKDDPYLKLPYDDSTIEKFTRWGNSAIYALVLLATILAMLDVAAGCFYFNVLNGAIVLVSATFLLFTELPVYGVPEQYVPMIRSLFGFLYVPVGRLAFVCYLALLLYGFSTFGVVIGVVMVVATFFNVFLYFKHPETRKEYHSLETPNYGSTAEAGGASAEL